MLIAVGSEHLKNMQTVTICNYSIMFKTVVYSYLYIQSNVRQCLRQVTWRQPTERGRVLRRTSVSFEEHHTDADFDRIHVSESFVLIFMFLIISTSREEQQHAHNYVELR